MTIESKRRAVFTVLTDYLRGETLWEVMWRLQNQFPNKSHYELNVFSSQRGDIPVVTTNRPQLYRQLISQLMANSSGLNPDPIEQMLQYRQQQEALGVFAADSADWSQAFSSVLEHLFGQLRSDTARQVKRFASEQAVRNGLP